MGVPVTTVDPTLSTALAPASPAATAFDPDASFDVELQRQVTAYVELGVPALLDLDEPGYRALLAPTTRAAPPSVVGGDDHVPFVLVLPQLDVNDLAPAMRRGTALGVSVIDRVEAPTYRAIVDVPDVPYLLWGVDTGSEFCSVTPENALRTIGTRGRTPLTLQEGVALTVLRSDMLRPNKCLSLAGSRTGTNQRVPAIWISERRAKLGWCWDRNPHTWLGTASAAGRVDL